MCLLTPTLCLTHTHTHTHNKRTLELLWRCNSLCLALEDVREEEALVLWPNLVLDLLGEVKDNFALLST